MTIEERVLLSRFTTLGTGGPARWFARPETAEDLAQALAWAAEREAAVSVVGLGSNMLVADEGVEALVLKLSGELAAAGPRARSCAPVEEPRSPSASTGRGPRRWEGSSSPARSPARRAAASG